MRTNKSVGNNGEEIAATVLRSRGVLLVEKIGTPMKLFPAKGQPGMYRIVFGEKVSGDHRGILPGGRSVLAETKTVSGDRLTFSELRKHQPERLSAHADAGGLSVLIWISDYGQYVLRWPVPGFRKGKSITLEQARALDVQDLEKEP